MSGVKKTIEREAEAAEATRHRGAPDGVTGSRPGRARAEVISVRLSAEEFEALKHQAAAESIPARTLARGLIVKGLRRDATSTPSDAAYDLISQTVRETVPEVLQHLNRA